MKKHQNKCKSMEIYENRWKYTKQHKQTKKLCKSMNIYECEMLTAKEHRECARCWLQCGATGLWLGNYLVAIQWRHIAVSIWHTHDDPLQSASHVTLQSASLWSMPPKVAQIAAKHDGKNSVMSKHMRFICDICRTNILQKKLVKYAENVCVATPTYKNTRKYRPIRADNSYHCVHCIVVCGVFCSVQKRWFHKVEKTSSFPLHLDC